MVVWGRPTMAWPTIPAVRWKPRTSLVSWAARSRLRNIKKQWAEYYEENYQETGNTGNLTT